MTVLLTVVALTTQGHTPPALTDVQAERRVHLTNVVAADRKYFDPAISEQDWANMAVNYVTHDGRLDDLSTFDYVFGQLGDTLLLRYAIPDGLTIPPDYVKQCESHGDYQAVNRRSGAGGAWQFLPATWRSLGGHGLPQDASPEEQDYRAALLWDDGAGAGQWACA